VSWGLVGHGHTPSAEPAAPFPDRTPVQPTPAENFLEFLRPEVSFMWGAVRGRGGRSMTTWIPTAPKESITMAQYLGIGFSRGTSGSGRTRQVSPTACDPSRVAAAGGPGRGGGRGIRPCSGAGHQPGRARAPRGASGVMASVSRLGHERGRRW
jgi:hypothetical protein